MTQHPPDPVSSRNASSLPGDDAAATDPALALADVWDLLDVLPSAAASADRMASTIEMAAVPDGGMLSGTSGGATSGGRRLTQAPAWSTVWQWLPGTALVLAALAAGIAMGRAIAPNPESAILANLPVVQHLDLLREARRDASELVARDPTLTAPEHALIRKKLLATYGEALGLADVG